jgi:Tol biopolymer transport system component/DNA-binding winged helix-turn-helix (wHTH) protein
MTGTKSFVYRFGDFELREREFSLVKAGEAVPIEHKAFRTLLFLLRNPKTLVPKEALLDAVWGDVAVADGALTRCIWLLRRLLGDDFNEPRYIETVAKVGYRFICDIEVIEDVQPAPVLAPDPPPPPPPPSPIWKWLIPIAAFLVGLAGAVWYLLRPLPPPRITGSTKITHDRLHKFLAGTDGTRLYVNLYEQGTAVQVAISSGETTEIPIALKDFVFIVGVSPDGETLLVYHGTDGTLWTTSTQGGSLRRLSDKPMGAAAWAPDGKSLFYTDDKGAFYVMRSDGTDVRKLTSSGGPALEMRVSPDGKTIRYTKDNQLWEISSAGSTPRRMLPDWPASTALCCGRWTADGEFFLFLVGDQHLTESVAADTGQLWAFDERRGLLRRPPAEPVKLTKEAIGWQVEAPGRDARMIFATGIIPLGELLRFDATAKLLQPYLGGISAEFLTFSPDGGSLAYVTFPEGILWRANRDGSGREQLTTPPLYPIWPRWSPDGSQILFTTSHGPQGAAAMFVISSQGGKTSRLLPRDNEDQSDPNWSPNGDRVVFADGPHNDLRIFDIPSHQVTRVPGSDNSFSPRWSPNGRKIAAMSMDTHTLKLFDIATERWSIPLQKNRSIAFPQFSHNSRYVYFMDLADPPGIYRIRISDNEVERVVVLTGVRHTGRWNAWFDLDPSDAPMVLREAGTDEIYALTLEAK